MRGSLLGTARAFAKKAKLERTENKKKGGGAKLAWVMTVGKDGRQNSDGRMKQFGGGLGQLGTLR